MIHFVPPIQILIFTSIFIDLVYSLRSEKIQGGNDIPQNRLTYIATILMGAKRCSAGILDENNVITAASCVASRNNSYYAGSVQVIVGRQYFHASCRFKYYVEQIFIPINYFFRKFFGEVEDIAILRLRGSLDLGARSGLSNVKVVKWNLKYSKDIAYVTGAGFTANPEIRGATYSSKVLYAEAYVYPTNKCRLTGTISDNELLCAKVIQEPGGAPRGVCKGDIGAPLVNALGNLIGILIVHQKNCDERQHFGVYTRVSLHRDFIEKVIKNRPDITIEIYTVPEEYIPADPCSALREE